MPRRWLSLLLVLLMIGWRTTLSSQIWISEFLADNTRTLADSDGDFSDWLEIDHQSSSPVLLAGFHLTDEESVPTKWQFPAIELAAGKRLVVFASGKARTRPGSELHTNFRLSKKGGYLGLVAPDGIRVIQSIRYGVQKPDVSQGLGRRFSSAPLIGPSTDVRVRIPPAGDSDRGWREPETPDDSWTKARLGIGFDVADRVAPNLIAFWDFNNLEGAATVLDQGDRHHDGTLIRAALSPAGRGRTSAAGDRALTLAGTGLMDVPSAARSMFATAVKTDAVTVSVWLRGDAVQPSNDSVFWAGSQIDGGGSRSLNAHVPWSDQVIYWDTGCCDASLNRVSIPDREPSHWRGAWNHYAFVKRGSVKEIWQNGKRLLQGVNTQKMTAIGSFFLGATSRSGASGYHGLIDDTALFEAALGEHEILALASGESPLRWQLFKSYIRTDIFGYAQTKPATAHIRVPFVPPDGMAAGGLQFRVRYNDGFIAYLNGHEISRRNVVGDDSTGYFTPQERDIAASVSLEEFFVDGSKLRPGTNLLAVLALNHPANDESFFFDLEVVAGTTLPGRFFSTPSPGQPNGTGTAGYLEPPVVSPTRGFYEANTAVTLAKRNPDSALVYTMDGSWPSGTNGFRFPVSMDHVSLLLTNTTVLRVAVVRDDYESPPITTHTYILAGRVPEQKAPAGTDSNWSRESSADFAMDARIVNNPNGPALEASLRSLPIMSVATSTDDMFGPRGIYRNPEARGDSWERKTSVEWFNTGSAPGFAADSGLRIHGNVSRQKSFTPKHSFSLIFRAEHGPPRLRHRLFPDSEETRFNRLVLRAGSTDTWAGVEWGQRVDGVLRWYRKDASYVRDQWVRDAQLDMGQPSAHGLFANLFVNGLYWGVYNVCERPDDEFAAAYLGGAPEEYDVLADFAELHAGNRQAWNQLISATSANLALSGNYQKLMGNAPNGLRNPALPVLLDVTNLVDYMILHIFIGADDWPNHNWWAARRQGTNSAGFKFFAWDQEISINSLVKQHSSWGPIYAEAAVAETPTYFYSRCRANADFRQLFADRIQWHLFQGPLSLSSNRQRWDRLSATVDASLVGESARWGDVWRRTAPYRREVEWLANHKWMQTVFFPSNHTVALKRFRAAKLYPSIDPPVFGSEGSDPERGQLVSLDHSNPSGFVYITVDGTDPRALGGGLSANARLYGGPFLRSRGEVILARVRTPSEWSALVRWTPSPTLELEISIIGDRQIKLRWKAGVPGGSSLESTQNLPASAWVSESFPVVESEGWVEVIVPPANGATFYRVRAVR